MPLAVDDFGTGYSNLNQLKSLPIDRQQLDRNFIDGVTVKRDDSAIATAIIAGGESMLISVLAEGIETQEQLQILRDRSGEKTQRYLVSRPLPVAEVAAVIEHFQTNPDGTSDKKPAQVLQPTSQEADTLS
jgi:EAL domain-containing protein (putative c-di-GMP-specific phosphodiesterase class I)